MQFIDLIGWSPVPIGRRDRRMYDLIMFCEMVPDVSDVTDGGACTVDRVQRRVCSLCKNDGACTTDSDVLLRSQRARVS
jgi:hypothetical protein